MTRGPRTESRPATQEKIEEAIRTLTPAQLVRLEKLAWFRHGTLGRRGAGRSEGDLLSDAIIAALDGRRKWVKENCSFMKFLDSTMRSLASHIRDGRAADAFDEIAPSPKNTDDSEDFPERVPTQTPVAPAPPLREPDLDRQVRELFKNDAVVLLVYESFLDGMKPADIRSCLGITENEYHAAAKRLRRAVRRLAEGGAR